MKPLIYFMCFLILFLSASALAQGVAVEAFVDKPTVSLEDQLILTIRVKGGNVFTEPQIPNRGNFDVLTRGSASNVEMINGRLSVMKEYTYVLGPRKTGTHEIGPITVSVEGVDYKAGPITVTVVSSEPSQPPVAPSPGLPQIPTLPHPPISQMPGFPPPSTEGEYKDVFVTAEVDNRNPYKGEQVIFTFRLYTSRNVGTAKLDLPDFHDFWSEEVQKEHKYYQELGGKRYVVNEYRVALFPTKAGPLTISPTTLRAEIEEPIGGINSFNDPFFTFRMGGVHYRPRVLKAPEISLEVKELPSGAPSHFTGLVGNFKVETQLSKKDLTVGDSATLSVNISGSGNIKDAVLSLNLNLPHLKVYEDKPAVNLQKSASGISGSKTFKIALVPEAPGRIQIPAISFSYFDPKKGSYEELSTSAYELAVVPGTEQEKLAKVQGGDKSQALPVNPLAEDIATIHSEAKLIHEEPSFEFYYLISLLFAAPPAIFLVAYLILRRQRWREANQEVIKKRKALSVALLRLKEIDLKKTQEIPAEMSRVVKEYLGDKLGLLGRALTPMEVEQVFSRNGKKKTIAHSLVQFLQELDAWTYGGIPKEKGWEREAIKKATGILKGVEKELS